VAELGRLHQAFLVGELADLQVVDELEATTGRVGVGRYQGVYLGSIGDAEGDAGSHEDPARLRHDDLQLHPPCEPRPQLSHGQPRQGDAAQRGERGGVGRVRAGEVAKLLGAVVVGVLVEAAVGEEDPLAAPVGGARRRRDVEALRVRGQRLDEVDVEVSIPDVVLAGAEPHNLRCDWLQRRRERQGCQQHL